MNATTFHSSDGEPLTVPAAAVAELRRSLDGASLAPGDEGYEATRRVWNAMIDRRPALIARCDGAADVQRCIAFARRHGVPLTVRGAGHNIGGRALADGALLVDLSHRREVRVDRDAGTVDVAPGATLGDLDAATWPHGRAVPTGIVSDTGVAGLTLGGGFGWLSRRWGLTCDHLDSVELVTADGEAIQADDASRPDLMWALRGGGGGLGVITRFRFRLRPLEHDVTAGMVVHSERRAALERFRRRTDDGPEELGCMLKLGAAPPAPFLDQALHGRPVAITVACHTGGADAAGRDLAPLRDTGSDGEAPAADLFQPRPFPQFQSMFDAGEPRGRRDYWKSEYVDALSDDMAAVLLGATVDLPSPHANVKVFHLGGAVARQPAGPTAAGHRDARYIVVVASAWEDGAGDAANVAWVRDAWERVHDLSRRGGYVNFLTEDAGADERGAAHGGVDLERLEGIRRRFDPQGLFATRAPSPAAA